jgi:hypothetical protein
MGEEGRQGKPRGALLPAFTNSRIRGEFVRLALEEAAAKYTDVARGSEKADMARRR